MKLYKAEITAYFVAEDDLNLKKDAVVAIKNEAGNTKSVKIMEITQQHQIADDWKMAIPWCRNIFSNDETNCLDIFEEIIIKKLAGLDE